MRDDGAVTEDRGGARERPRLRRETGEPQAHQRRDRVRADLADALDLRRVGDDALIGERGEGLANQQRKAARGFVAGRAELLVGLGGERVAHEQRHGREPERSRAQHPGLRDRLGEQRGARARVA